MKTGKTLVELATEIERQRESRVDYIAPTERLAFEVGETGSDVEMLGLKDDPIELNDLAHGQVASHTEIPKVYYDRMRREAPGLLADNVNHWFNGKPAKRMVRTLDGRARAFLSDAYRPLENADLAEAVLPILMDLDLELVSSEITERRLYLKAVDKRINRDIPSGRKMGDGSHHFFDTVSPALVISNSEVGCGALSVESAVWTKACTNLAIFSQHSMRKYHVGGRHQVTDDLVHLLSDETKRATDKAVWMQVRDVVRGAFDEAAFDARLDEVRGMAEQPIQGDPVKVIDLAAKTLDIRELEKPSILRHLIEGGDLSRYGLFNAVTRTAEDAACYDRATDLERLGGKLIDLSANDWRKIAEAA
jgi:hypothetical protein